MLLLLAACLIPGDQLDPDGDGFTWSDDCGPDDASVFPDADEVCDGIDNDCDGDVDEGLAALYVWYADRDGDGFGDALAVDSGCLLPDGVVDNGDDCDDSTSSVNPLASDGTQDGVDQNCDSVDGTDADGDGQASDATGGEDCDDSESRIYVGAAEICGDGVVNDCEGDRELAYAECGLSGEFDLSAADAKFIGEGAGDLAGVSVSGAEDVNGDGLSDILIGSVAGSAYLILGRQDPLGFDLSAADVRFIEEKDGDLASANVSSAGDVDGDGLSDILVGAVYESSGGEKAGAVYLILGREDPLGIDLSTADAKFIGEQIGDNAGDAVSSAGDVNGDGLSDILIGAYKGDSGGGNAGAAYLILGREDPRGVDLSAADAKFVGEEEDDFAGRSVSSAGDVDGDGLSDILVGAFRKEISGGLNAGATYLILGREDPVGIDLSAADAMFSGESGEDYAGVSVSSAGDVDGDGLSDVLVGAYGEGSGGGYAGAAYLILGRGAFVDFDLSDAQAKFIGEEKGDFAGISVSSAGDVDGDGLSDILIGAYSGDSLAGAAYLILGREEPLGLDLSASDAKFIGEEAGDQAGFSVSSAGDVDGDGRPDILLGALEEDSGGDNAGAAYLILGRGY